MGREAPRTAAASGVIAGAVIASLAIGPSEPPAVVAATTPAPAPVPSLAPGDPIASELVWSPGPNAPRHVVIISEDGMRPDALTHALAPRHVALMAEGARARDARTIELSDTLPAHASMLSGVLPERHGLVWDGYKPKLGFIQAPTIFAQARVHGLTTAMIVGKTKLQHLALPGSLDYFDRPSFLCAGVSARAAEYFTSFEPSLMFVHFSDPDEYGHRFRWMSPRYALAVTETDRCLARVLAAIDASGARDSTLVIVTADHGGHGRYHSNSRQRADTIIPWIVRGPGVPAGAIVDGPVTTVDTAATALAALGLPPLPDMVGTPRFVFQR
jgi:arylsulfatase A-like enzyme